jgi:hypothetical protein
VVLLGVLAGAAQAGEKPEFDIYGFLRYDMMRHDSQMNNNLVPMWVRNEYDGSVIKDDPALAHHPRLTRVGMRFSGWQLSDRWKADVGIEIDFQNFAGGSESRQTPRMRLGYIRLHYGYWQFMGGQHWDIISPLFPNINLNGVNWNIGNLGDRRPQLRVTFAPQLEDGGALYFTGALCQGGAVNMADVDKNAVPDGQDSDFGQIQGRFGVKEPITDNYELRCGVWGHFGQDEVFINDTTLVKRDFDSWSAGADIWFSIHKRFRIQGEFWTGENLADVRGGIGQSTIPEEGIGIRSSGGWGEFNFDASAKVTLIAGYSLDDPKDEDLIYNNMRTKNQLGYAGVRWKPWPKSFMLSLEYMHFRTDYTGFDETSVNNHTDVHFMYFF